MIDWETNITLTIGYAIGFIVGCLAGVAWYWFPLAIVGGLFATAAYDLAKGYLLNRKATA